jgi:hypothetical protein
MISAATRQSSAPDTWRTHPLKVRGRYQAMNTFGGFPNSNFQAGETYLLESVEYNGSCFSTIFTFQKRGTAGPILWLWYDDEPGSLWQDRFRPAA